MWLFNSITNGVMTHARPRHRPTSTQVYTEDELQPAHRREHRERPHRLPSNTSTWTTSSTSPTRDAVGRHDPAPRRRLPGQARRHAGRRTCRPSCGTSTRAIRCAARKQGPTSSGFVHVKDLYDAARPTATMADLRIRPIQAGARGRARREAAAAPCSERPHQDRPRGGRARRHGRHRDHERHHGRRSLAALRRRVPPWRLRRSGEAGRRKLSDRRIASH